MRKTATGRNSHAELARPRVLRLGRETIRTLRAEDLANAIGGSCDTTSDTTDYTRTRTKEVGQG